MSVVLTAAWLLVHRWRVQRVRCISDRNVRNVIHLCTDHAWTENYADRSVVPKHWLCQLLCCSLSWGGVGFDISDGSWYVLFCSLARQQRGKHYSSILWHVGSAANWAESRLIFIQTHTQCHAVAAREKERQTFCLYPCDQSHWCWLGERE